MGSPIDSGDNRFPISIGDKSFLTCIFPKMDRRRIMNKYARLHAIVSGILFLVIMPAYSWSQPANLALGKAVLASSFENANTHSGGIDFIPAYAVDGKANTRWGSDWHGDPDKDKAWISVDLGSEETVSEVRILWEESYAKKFAILLSLDGQDWATAAEIENPSAMASKASKQNFVKLDNPQNARYVKLDLRKRASVYGYSLYEFEIY
jgi:hypothetical protein